MTRQEAIALLRKMERVDRTVRAEGTPAIQERWNYLYSDIRRLIVTDEVKESM